MWIVAYIAKYLLSTRTTLKYGIPDYPVYFVSGVFANSLERALVMAPSHIIMAKLIPKGVEASMFAVSSTILSLNQFTIRATLGFLINDNFVFVTRKNLGDYWKLNLIGLTGAIIPLSYLYCMVPSIAETQNMEEENKKKKTEQEIELR